ncbi:hypothetical protein [Flaviaesturariibacter amylovorans]|uniref:Peptidase M23 n=1 Tax=Flaviaesturariibacter amylovorans TaxID=1084520 RepID=A0ABP8GLM3_9BACT
MSKLDPGTTLRRLRNRYRLMVMNEDTYEEVVTFRLSRLSVYVALCTVFVLLTSLTVAIVVFTPVRYYIPGYGSTQGGYNYRKLKYRTDSLEKQVAYQARYIENLRQLASGGEELKLDTTQLVEPDLEGGGEQVSE